MLQLALNEDLGVPFFDATTALLFENTNINSKAKIISKQATPFVVCGTSLTAKILQHFSDSVEFNTPFRDGDVIHPGETLLTLQGSITTLLMIERTLLNFLQYLSAIATCTQAFVKKVQHTNLKILDTRKTTPGMRHLAKYAVFCGGGVNHRAGLYDAVLVKDNHIDALGGMGKMLERLPLIKKFNTIIEVRTLAELEGILNHGLDKVDRVLLDNMSPAELKTCVELCKNKIQTEASGNITLDTVVTVAETGVDYASIGKLTHSIASVDLSMLL